MVWKVSEPCLDGPPDGGPQPLPPWVTSPLFRATLLFLVLPVLIAILGAAVLPPSDDGQKKQETGRFLIAAWAQVLAHGVFVAWAYKNGMRATRKGASLWRVPLLWMGVVVVWWVFLAGYMALLEKLGHQVETQAAVRLAVGGGPGSLTFWTVALSAVVIAPIAEELMFRGYLAAALHRHGHGIACLVSSALFGLLHGLDIALPLGLLGAFFYWLRVRFGGLAAPMIAHACHNGVTIMAAAAAPDTFGL